MITGACLCGALCYEVEGRLQSPIHCHCSMCRKHHGAPFATFVTVPEQGLRWLRVDAALLEYASSASRVRRSCSVCGAVAPAPVRDVVLLPAGNLLGELNAAGGVHVFVGSKAPWHVIADDLPQHDAAPPGWTLHDVPRLAQTRLEGATHGSCSCGAVSFSVTGTPARWLQCHCSRCRRGRSAAHGSNTFYPTAQFAWRAGAELVRKYSPPDAERFTVSFCVRCGGAAPVERDNVPFVLVPAGVFDGDPGARPQAHIHVASKAPWYTISDGLPQYPALPPS